MTKDDFCEQLKNFINESEAMLGSRPTIFWLVVVASQDSASEMRATLDQ